MKNFSFCFYLLKKKNSEDRQQRGFEIEIKLPTVEQDYVPHLDSSPLFLGSFVIFSKPPISLILTRGFFDLWSLVA